MTYTATLVEGNRYEVETEFDGEPIKFHVVVAENESEIAGLVQFRLNELANPTTPTAPVSQTPTPDLTAVIQQLNETITQQAADIAALKAKVGV